MPKIAVNDIDLFYEVSGDPSNPPVFLVAGLGVQIVAWPPHFIEALEAHHYVIRYDNRDIGLSTTFDDAPGDPQSVMDAMLNGHEPDVAYTLNEMADDGVALMEALEISSAHVVGVSMGGMIAHLIAIRHSERVRSLTSIMSTTGALDVGQPSAEAMTALFAPSARGDRDAVIANNIASAKIWASPDYFDEDRLRGVFTSQWDRVDGPQSANGSRHFCAVMATASREEGLANVAVPTLVVHGTSDTLITPSGGERTAAIIPGAELMLIEGMGHDLPIDFSERIVKAIGELVIKAG